MCIEKWQCDRCWINTHVQSAYLCILTQTMFNNNSVDDDDEERSIEQRSDPGNNHHGNLSAEFVWICF